MKFSGEATLNAPVEKVWDAILDPDVLVHSIPGCQRLDTTGENAYDMTVTAGVAAVKGTYAGRVALTDLRPHESLVLSAQGSGAPGTIAADVKVNFTDRGDGTTRISYDADAIVGGMIGGVGQRMLSSVSKRMAGEFFKSVDDVLNGRVKPAKPAAAAPAATTVPAAAAPAGALTAAGAPAGGNVNDLLKAALVGAALVLLGVAAGVLARRGR